MPPLDSRPGRGRPTWLCLKPRPSGKQRGSGLSGDLSPPGTPAPLLSFLPESWLPLRLRLRLPAPPPDRSAHNALAPFGIPTSDVKQKGFEQKTQDAALNCQQCQDLNPSVPLNILKTS